MFNFVGETDQIWFVIANVKIRLKTFSYGPSLEEDMNKLISYSNSREYKNVKIQLRKS